MVAAILATRRDTAADWATNNPVLADGELGIETDTEKMKRGDGVTAWNMLPYSLNEAAGLPIGTTANTICRGDDPRLDTVDAATLDAASTPLGDEKVLGLQGGLPRLFSVDQLNPDITRQRMGHLRAEQRSFTHFLDLPHGSSVTTTGEVIGNEPVTATVALGGSVERGSLTDFSISQGVLACKTGTNIFGRGGIVSNITPVLRDVAANYFRYGIYAGLSAIPTTTSNEFAIYIGLMSDPETSPTDGLYFFADHTSANWKAVSMNNGTATTVDTAIPVATSNKIPVFGAWYTYDILYHPDNSETKFFINGTEVATIANTLNYPRDQAEYFCAKVQNLGDTVDNKLWIDAQRGHNGLIGTTYGGVGFGTGHL